MHRDCREQSVPFHLGNSELIRVSQSIVTLQGQEVVVIDSAPAGKQA